jgi:putative Ca2+/H+ antiporter (TMEM165/GDT1 family)
MRYTSSLTDREWEINASKEVLMESLTTVAIASALLFKAFEKGGEKLGEAVSDKIGKLLNIIREKFKAEGVEGKLTKAQKDPSEKNKNRLEQELAPQMEDDEAFANKLKNLVDELKLDQRVQSFFKGVNVTGRAEIGDVEQIAASGGSVQQEAVTDVTVGGDFTIGNVKQQG